MGAVKRLRSKAIRELDRDEDAKAVFGFFVKDYRYVLVKDCKGFEVKGFKAKKDIANWLYTEVPRSEWHRWYLLKSLPWDVGEFVSKNAQSGKWDDSRGRWKWSRDKK